MPTPVPNQPIMLPINRTRHTTSQGWQYISGDDFAHLPSPAPWLVHHRECDPDIDSVDYCIDVERARTHARLLSWTSHLMEKNWLQSTDWERVIRNASAVNV